jgi:hypothetical protein
MLGLVFWRGVVAAPKGLFGVLMGTPVIPDSRDQDCLVIGRVDKVDAEDVRAVEERDVPLSEVRFALKGPDVILLELQALGIG